ncbi:MAG TPA: ankyrin repeat domain-containing protein [Opitutaceae bacterium]|nr:ankyrin repeat domain-containing protein [Opitutaceae bacterium]
MRPRISLALAAGALASAALYGSTVVVNTHEKFQTMDGFGACIVTYDLLPEYLDHAFYDLAVFDLGMSILRLPIGAVEVTANDNADPKNFAWNAIDKETMGYAMEIARQFRARGVGRIFATPWTPPEWMKTNRSEVVGGRLRPDMRDEYAEFLSAYVRGAKQFFNVQIDAVSLQNELLFVEPYESCVYNPFQLREALRAVHRRFNEDGLAVDLILPEDMGFPVRVSLYVEPLMADPETRNFRGLFASHGGNGFANWRRVSSELAPFGRKFWMTETSGQNPDWQGGMALAENMHDTIAGGNASAFIYWQISEPKPGRAALFAAGDYTPKAQAAKHFIRFVRPGMQRVHVGGDAEGVLASAYKHPETGDMAVVLVNKSRTDATVDLDVIDPNPPAKWLVFTSHDRSYHREADTVSTSGIAVPAQGIVTLYGRSGDALAELPSLVPAGWERPALGKALSADSANTTDQRLHAAARANDVALVRKLLGEKLDPNALNVGKLSPLHRAAYPGHVDVVKSLVEGGADPDVRDGTGGSPMHIAARNGHENYVEAIVAAGADVNLADNRGVTALDRASLGGHLTTVKALLKFGANPNQADTHGWTALHWAAASPSRSSVEVLKTLIEAGAKADVKDAEGHTPLHTAAANLISPGFFHRQSQTSVIYLNAERLRVLVDAGAGVNERDVNGRTALHWAAWLGETVHGEDVAGRSFFQYRTEAIRYLLAAGADPQLKDSADRIAADYAGAEGYDEAASVLKVAATLPWLAGRPPIPGKGIQIEEATRRPAFQMGRRLQRAASSGELDVVRQLLAGGANPNISNPQGGTPLHAAVIGGHLAVVQALLDAGADGTRRDSDGYTPLERAMQNNQTEIADALRKAADAPPVQP